MSKSLNTKVLTEVAILVALATVLSYIRFVVFPEGGSVTLASMVPLVILSYRRGWKVGIFACLVYGLIQFYQDPWMLNWAQFILEYPVAFGVIGLAGLSLGSLIIAVCSSIMIGYFIWAYAPLLGYAATNLISPEMSGWASRLPTILVIYLILLFALPRVVNRLTLIEREGQIRTSAMIEGTELIGAVFGLGLRFLAHTLAGVVFWSEYAPPGMSPVLYSVIYNGTYMLPEIIISGVFVYALMKRGIFEMNL